jgi:hypothetical protein
VRTVLLGHARAGRCLAARSFGCPLCTQRAEDESRWVCAGACASQQAALSVRARSQRRSQLQTQSRHVPGSLGVQAGTGGVARLRRRMRCSPCPIAFRSKQRAHSQARRTDAPRRERLSACAFFFPVKCPFSFLLHERRSRAARAPRLPVSKSLLCATRRRWSGQRGRRASATGSHTTQRRSDRREGRAAPLRMLCVPAWAGYNQSQDPCLATLSHTTAPHARRVRRARRRRATGARSAPRSSRRRPSWAPTRASARRRWARRAAGRTRSRGPSAAACCSRGTRTWAPRSTTPWSSCSSMARPCRPPPPPAHAVSRRRPARAQPRRAAPSAAKPN